MKIKKGDTVIVIAGKDRGKSGTVLTAFPKKDMILIDGMHMVKKHQKARRQGQKGQVIDRALPMHVSNVALKDSKTGTATRVGYQMQDGKKVRIAKKSGTKIAA
ncbi:50S ribosomal protein L24 [Patescibacteria group bacterium]|jgi:large subunit ribosomal protein L24|nr:50S ribosomal protein L24 [Patescibacteria group bacterium]